MKRERPMILGLVLGVIVAAAAAAKVLFAIVAARNCEHSMIGGSVNSCTFL